MKKSSIKIIKSTKSVNKYSSKKWNTPTKPAKKYKISQINFTHLRDNSNQLKTIYKTWKVKTGDLKFNYKAVESNSTNNQLLSTFTLKKTFPLLEKTITISTGKSWNFISNLIRETHKSISYIKKTKNFNTYSINCNKKIITINNTFKNKYNNLSNMKDN